MHRIDTATKATDLFGAGKHGFKDGDKALGIAATDLTAAFFNDLQENIAQLVEAGGDALAKGNYTQLLTTLIKKGMQGNYFNVALAAGTSDAITAAYAPVIAALTDGMELHVRAAAANTTATPTFTPAAGTIAAKTMVKGNNLALVPNDIPGAGHWLNVKYDLTLDKWVLLNPATGVLSSTPVGAMLYLTGSSVPSGYLKANGALLSRTAYPALWAYAQSSGNLAASDGVWQNGQYSPGDGATTFRIPDLRGEFIRIWDDGRGVDSGRSIGSSQTDAFKAHTHAITNSSSSAGAANAAFYGDQSSPYGSSITTSVGGTETRPRNIAQIACIKY